ncbi:MAG: glycosyltransferase family 4 protein [Chloroflexota bacterium]|nr:glycosyltransferase family 4 protein [Chloroflexota bacterium]
MRILVDASAAFDQQAGIGRYARNVLSQAALHHPTAQWTMLRFPERLGAPPFPFDTNGAWLSGQTRRRNIPITRRWADQIFFRARVPLDVRWIAGRTDVIYSPDFTVPPAGRTARVVTIHDLAFLTHPQWAPLALRRFLGRVVPQQVRQAAAVAVVSEATRDDVLSVLEIEPDRVHLVRNGVEDRFFASTPLSDEERRALRIPSSYLLMVGTLEPRKNHLNVFQALKHLPPSVRMPLVLAGKRGWDDEPILAGAAPLFDAERVIWLDYVPDDQLPALYAGAAAVVYPSWTEGFGLPVLEGLASGVPVVTSRAPALQEVGGNQVVYAEAASPESIAAAIVTALESDDEKRRAQRQLHARSFSWQESGQQLANLLRTVVEMDVR